MKDILFQTTLAFTVHVVVSLLLDSFSISVSILFSLIFFVLICAIEAFKKG